MKLGSLIDKNYILAGNDFNNVMEAIDEFIEIFEKKNILPVSPEDVKKVFAEREKLGSTILPGGISIPHGRIEGFNDLLIGLWIPPKPIQQGDEEIKVMFFVLTSKVGSQLYLPLLSAIAKRAQTQNFPNELIGKSPNQIHEILNEITLKKEVTVENIMTLQPITCKKNTTLAELADIFYHNGLSYIPVVDDNMTQIGEVTIKDLLSEGVPDYVKRLGNVSFLKTLSPFEELLKNEDKILVEKIMRKSSRSISKDASIIEAVSTITSKGYRHLPVLENGKIIGVISETDILQKVLRG
ncbi:MAG: CBS domain-containing protein [Spirochaetales bacterium]|nr:CBS domain-containing protein [Spirochaetales bacterium]